MPKQPICEYMEAGAFHMHHDHIHAYAFEPEEVDGAEAVPMAEKEALSYMEGRKGIESSEFCGTRAEALDRATHDYSAFETAFANGDADCIWLARVSVMDARKPPERSYILWKSS
jgi:hypothetical protein